MVDFAANMLNQTDNLYLLNTPEGSRSWAKQWKTGFYYIAEKARVPIVLSYCDYQKKIAGSGKVIGINIKSKDDVMMEIQEYYIKIKEKYQEHCNHKII